MCACFIKRKYCPSCNAKVWLSECMCVCFPALNMKFHKPFQNCVEKKRKKKKKKEKNANNT